MQNALKKEKKVFGCCVWAILFSDWTWKDKRKRDHKTKRIDGKAITKCDGINVLWDKIKWAIEA